MKAERRRAFIDAWVVSVVSAAHVSSASHGTSLTTTRLEAMVREERRNAAKVHDINIAIEKDEVFIP